MGDKVRGAIAILVGAFALVQSYRLYQGGVRNGRLWLELAAGAVLIVLGTWRIRRRPDDPAAELLK